MAANTSSRYADFVDDKSHIAIADPSANTDTDSEPTPAITNGHNTDTCRDSWTLDKSISNGQRNAEWRRTIEIEQGDPDSITLSRTLSNKGDFQLLLQINKTVVHSGVFRK